MADKRTADEEIEEQTASALPQREAMSVIAPPTVAGLIKVTPADSTGDSTGQGIDESSPEGDA